ncbi:MAG: hypothetical protein CL535_20135 [Ahrensia sp.]|nr:hypothetical protein [Ahrensia sp.]|tara:strand:- start:2612 stop:2818 length:207 start_codon:yes stop_codon:yes gene_type:complete
MKVVAPIHPKAMPVIPATQEENEAWLTAGRQKPRNCIVPCQTTCSGKLPDRPDALAFVKSRRIGEARG